MWRVISLRGICLSPLLAAMLICGCGHRRQYEQAARRYAITGMVMDRDDIRSRLTISHDAVSGFMPAMTMSFRVANLNPDVQPGDKVRGTLVVMPDDGWIEGLTVVRKSAGMSVARPRSTPGVTGDEVPEFSLRNQDDRAVDLRGFRGSFLIMTFIYTRCPFPDYCPLMMKNLNAVRRELQKTPELSRKVHLMSVTIDPAHDTPEVLRAYGRRTISGPEPFSTWDLVTGPPDEIRRLANWCGLTYYEESGQITHSLATVIVGPSGRLIQILSGNAWRPQDLLDILVEQRTQNRAPGGIAH